MRTSAIIGMDGNCGYCLLGKNIQEGEVEFVCVDDAPEIHKENGIRAMERWAMAQAHKRLCKRLGKQIPYYISTDHWGN